MIKQEYNIVRRAYSQRTIVARVITTFVEANALAMKMQRDLQDGEYFAVPVEYGLKYPATGADQSCLPIAWV